MLVSIICPTHNSERFVSETIISVLKQTYAEWELIVVDDCSTDGTLDVVRSYSAQDSRIKLLRLEANLGAAVARNTGIDTANGHYIAFLDSDDIWEPVKLERQVAFMQSNSYVFTYAAYKKINDTGDVVGAVGVPTSVSYKQLLKTCSIGCLTAMYDVSYFGKVHMPLVRKRQDYGLWLKLLKMVAFAHGINEPLGRYRVHANSISANKAEAAKYTWRLYRDVESLNLCEASYYFAHYAIRGFLRSRFPSVAKAIGVLK